MAKITIKLTVPNALDYAEQQELFYSLLLRIQNDTISLEVSLSLLQS